MDYDHKKIGFTAWIVAHARTLSDIPYSQEIYAQLKSVAESQHQLVPAEETMDNEVAPLFETRYKLGNLLLRASACPQILEIAAGFSPRGLELSENPEINFIEMDLADVIEQKRKSALEILARRQQNRPNLHFVAGNVLDAADFQKAEQYLDQNKPVAVINEGLLRYLTFEEKALVAKNVLNLLKKFSGVWLTPDVQNAGDGDLKLAEKSNQKIMQAVGRDLKKNYFKDQTDAINFFEELGFKVEQRYFSEVFESLVTPKVLGFSRAQIQNMLGGRVFFVMRPAV